jgi:hypothetical protein
MERRLPHDKRLAYTVLRGTPATHHDAGDLHALGQQSWIPGRSMPLRGMSGKSVELSFRLVYGGRDRQRRRYR